MFIDHVRAITSEEEYDAALKAVRPYFEHEPEAGGAEAARFDGLFALIEQYEASRHPIPAAAPADVVREVMAANGYSRADLVEVIGSKARASDLLSGRRSLSLEQIRRLRAAWGIPADALIADLQVA